MVVLFQINIFFIKIDTHFTLKDQKITDFICVLEIQSYLLEIVFRICYILEVIYH